MTLSWTVFKENGIDLAKYLRTTRGENAGEEVWFPTVKGRVAKDKNELAPKLEKMGLNSFVEIKGYNKEHHPIYNLDKFAGYIHDKFGRGVSYPQLRSGYSFASGGEILSGIYFIITGKH